ncbi:hypothetical protein ZWY2020_035312 [Hordeum vulgare]|nr:hypothetical protein ZWY2020_035312 [Hordeum vulgare]
MGSCLPWGSLPLILFVLLQPMLHSSSGCFVEERSALLDIRSSLPRAHSLSLSALDSWGEDGDDCCSWERVKCNNTTQRVSHLNLISIFQTYSHDHWYLNLTVFSALHELEYLDLSNNNPCSLLAMEGLVGLSKLRFLDLSRTTEGGGFPDILGRIVSLEGLSLYGNYMTGGLSSAAFGNFRNLRQLDMSWNSFSGDLPALLFTLPSLWFLDLSINSFSGQIPINSSSGPISLEVLNLGFNNLSGTLPVGGSLPACIGNISFKGCIPNSGQLGSFSMDSYLANTNLHKITHGDTCAAPGPDPAVGKDMEEMPGDRVLYVATAAGFVLAFWATIGFSFCHPYIRSVMLKL